jgi:hypothetical protein
MAFFAVFLMAFFATLLALVVAVTVIIPIHLSPLLEWKFDSTQQITRCAVSRDGR